MSSVVHVPLGSRSYGIEVGCGLLEKLGATCRERFGSRSWMLVSDDTVASLYAGRVAPGLRHPDGLFVEAIVPAGEQSKSLACLQGLYERAAQAPLDRDAMVLALGGGMVGDLAGFLAATYLRGIALVQVPTTLLAMVDSAVGGKTAVNLAAGKNLVGAFHQPAAVYSDLDVLTTLPEREYRSGLAEVVKYAAIHDGSFWDWIEREADALLARDRAVLETAVRRCCEIKADFVAGDERETGRRALLNFGHTLGHALELADGYRDLRHGEAVALGMVFAARLSARAGLDPGVATRLIALLQRLGLPVAAPGASWEQIRAGMARDKKARAGVPAFVLLSALGEARAGCAVDEAAAEEEYRRWPEWIGGASWQP